MRHLELEDYDFDYIKDWLGKSPENKDWLCPFYEYRSDSQYCSWCNKTFGLLSSDPCPCGKYGQEYVTLFVKDLLKNEMKKRKKVKKNVRVESRSVSVRKVRKAPKRR